MPLRMPCVPFIVYLVARPISLSVFQVKGSLYFNERLLGTSDVYEHESSGTVDNLILVSHLLKECMLLIMALFSSSVPF